MNKREELMFAEDEVWKNHPIEGAGVDPKIAYDSKIDMIRLVEWAWGKFLRDIIRTKLSQRQCNFLELAGGSGYPTGIISHYTRQEESAKNAMLTFITSDGSKYAVKKAQDVNTYMKTNTQYTQALIDDFRIIDAHKILDTTIGESSQDIVFILAGLHHFYELQTVVDEVYKVLKPGGHFICVGEPIAPWFLKPIWGHISGARARELEEGVQEHIFTLTELNQALKNFKEVNYLPIRNPEFRSGSKMRQLYYTFSNWLPDKIFLKLLFAGTTIICQK